MDIYIHKAETGLRLALDAINSIPASSWYLLGSFLAAGILGSIGLAVVTYYHKWNTAEKYAKSVTGYILMLVTGALAVSDYFITNSTSFLPFMGAAYPTIYMAATKFYQFGGSVIYKNLATAIGSWANLKYQPKRSIFTTNLKNPADTVRAVEAEDLLPEDKTRGSGLFD